MDVGRVVRERSNIRTSAHAIPTTPVLHRTLTDFRKDEWAHLDHLVGSDLVRASDLARIDLLPRDSIEKIQVLLRHELFAPVVLLVSVRGSSVALPSLLVPHRRGQVNLADGRDESDNFKSVGVLQVLLGNRTSSDST